MVDRSDASVLKQSVKVRRMLGEARLHITEVTVSLCISTLTHSVCSVLTEVGYIHICTPCTADGYCLGWRRSIQLFTSKHFLLTAHCQEQWPVKRAVDLCLFLTWREEDLMLDSRCLLVSTCHNVFMNWICNFKDTVFFCKTPNRCVL